MFAVFRVKDSMYSECWLEYDNNKRIITNEKHGFFDGDTVLLQEDNVLIKTKCILHDKYIPGTLRVTGQMYGKHKKNKYFYKFVPYDKKLPSFLVAYKQINNFHKYKTDIYVSIRLIDWSCTSKHPYGEIHQTFGNVNILENTYDYLLECYDLKTSHKNMKLRIKEQLKKYSVEEWYSYLQNKHCFEDRRNYDLNIFSIDPVGTQDIDDACSIRKIDSSTLCISIYIAHVPVWLNAFDVGKYLSELVSTVYLPTKKQSMLPEILSEDICSLKEGHDKFAFTLDLYVHTKTHQIKYVEWKNTYIHIHKNATYDTVSGKDYELLFETISCMNKVNRYIQHIISDSHDVVEYLMICMNTNIASMCMKNKVGIYRNLLLTETCNVSNIDKSIEEFMHIWNSPGGKYTMYTENVKDMRHDLLQVSAYMHVTSPIRRLVDILNMSIFWKYTNNTACITWIDKWLCNKGIEKINQKAKYIRRLQNECTMLHQTVYSSIENTIQKGFVIQKKVMKENYEYKIYFPYQKCIHSVIFFIEDKNLQIYKKYDWKISFIDDDYRIHKRWLLTLIE